MFNFGSRIFHTFCPIINTASIAPAFLPQISVDSNVGVEDVAGEARNLKG